MAQKLQLLFFSYIRASIVHNFLTQTKKYFTRYLDMFTRIFLQTVAAMSLNASTMKLALVFVVCLAIFASSTMTLVTADSNDFDIAGCIPFIGEGAMCVVEALRLPTRAIKTCCKAIFKLNDCDSDIFGNIPQADMEVVRHVCRLLDD